jgi:uncharacterized protein with HEPN domain
MVLACRRIREFVQGIDHAAFLADAKTQSAVIHQVLLLGEAAKRLSPEFCRLRQQIPWSEIARTRDILIHHYEGVDVAEVWRIADVDVPVLLANLERACRHTDKT